MSGAASKAVKSHPEQRGSLLQINGKNDEVLAEIRKQIIPALTIDCAAMFMRLAGAAIEQIWSVTAVAAVSRR